MNNHNLLILSPRRMLLLLLQWCGYVALTWSYTRPYLRRQDMCGIWKISPTATGWRIPSLDTPSTTTDTDSAREDENNSIFPSHPSVSSMQPSTSKNSPSQVNQHLEEVILRLNEDGTFDPYTPMISEEDVEQNHSDNLEGILSRGGSWEYQDGALILAADRPKHLDSSKIHDTLLVGKLDVKISESLTFGDSSNTSVLPETTTESNDEKKGETGTNSTVNSSNKNDEEIDVHLSVPTGNIDIGKFMYPKSHKAFFDEPILFKRSNIGSFQMNQVLGNLNARLKEEREVLPKPEPKFRKDDFFNRTFFLTTAPHPVHPKMAELDTHYDESKATLDVRVMPITFFPNSTFTALGTEKVLRGRFDIHGEEGDRLYFRVSLFGFGRSVSGSVFSEGRLLTQDDRRAYLGTIQSYTSDHDDTNDHSLTRIFVEGEFYYGAGPEALRKSNSFGTFSLQEVDGFENVLIEEDDEEEEEEDKGIADDDDSSVDGFWDDSTDAFQ